MKKFILSFFIFGSISNAAYYQDVLVCNGGAVSVQVDLGERRNVRLIIQDTNIKKISLRKLKKSELMLLKQENTEVIYQTFFLVTPMGMRKLTMT